MLPVGIEPHPNPTHARSGHGHGAAIGSRKLREGWCYIGSSRAAIRIAPNNEVNITNTNTNTSSGPLAAVVATGSVGGVLNVQPVIHGFVRTGGGGGIGTACSRFMVA